MDDRHKDFDVLLRLRRVGLHPAVHVFEPIGDRTSLAQSLVALAKRASGDQTPVLELVTDPRTA